MTDKYISLVFVSSACLCAFRKVGGTFALKKLEREEANVSSWGREFHEKVINRMQESS